MGAETGRGKGMCEQEQEAGEPESDRTGEMFVVVETGQQQQLRQVEQSGVKSLPCCCFNTDPPSVVSSGYFLCVIASRSDTTETWPALSRSQTLACYGTGSRS